MVRFAAAPQVLNLLIVLPMVSLGMLHFLEIILYPRPFRYDEIISSQLLWKLLWLSHDSHHLEYLYAWASYASQLKLMNECSKSHTLYGLINWDMATLTWGGAVNISDHNCTYYYSNTES